MQHAQITVSEEAAKLASVSQISRLVEDAERHPRRTVADFHFYHHRGRPTLVVVRVGSRTTSVLTESEAADMKARLQAVAGTKGTE